MSEQEISVPQFAPSGLIPEVGVVKDLPFEMYVAEPAVSSGMVRMFAKGKTAAHAKAKYIDNKVKYDSDDLEFGRKAHLILLEPERFRSCHVVMPVFEGKTKDGKMSTRSKEAIDKKVHWLSQLPKNAIVVSEEEREQLTSMLNQLLRHSLIPTMLGEGVSELSLFWLDPETKVRCKARLDYISFGKKALIDYKTTGDATHESFTRDTEKFGYQIQLAHYQSGCRTLKLLVEDLMVIAQEKEYPHLPIAYFLNEIYMDDGHMRRRAAMEKIAKCYKENRWPGYEEKVHELMPPGWLAYKEVL